MKHENSTVVSVDPAGTVWKGLPDGSKVALKGETDWRRLATKTAEQVHAEAVADLDCPPTKGEDWAEAWRPADLVELRKSLGLSQAAFAQTYGLSVRTVQDWEQGRKTPDRPARVLVSLIARAPQQVASLLHRA